MAAEVFGRGAYLLRDREEAERQTGWGQEQGTPRITLGKLLPPAKFHILKFLERQKTAPPAGNLTVALEPRGSPSYISRPHGFQKHDYDPQTQRQVAWKS